MHLDKRRRRALLVCTLLAACSAVAGTNTETSLAEATRATPTPLESLDTTKLRQAEPEQEPELEPEPAPQTGAESETDARVAE
ncbi:hypothetical protein FRC07_006939, partial [Ceratobasidium sp. 392]